MGFNALSLDSRKLGTAGQKLGGAAVLCHIKHDPVDPGGSFTLTSANVGRCQTVLCRNGKPLPLSRSYVMSCEEELRRIKQHKAIVTEVRREPFSWEGGRTGPGSYRNQRGSFPSKECSLKWFKITILNPWCHRTNSLYDRCEDITQYRIISHLLMAPLCQAAPDVLWHCPICSSPAAGSCDL